jgi:hypothetical protein
VITAALKKAESEKRDMTQKPHNNTFDSSNDRYFSFSTNAFLVMPNDRSLILKKKEKKRN